MFQKENVRPPLTMMVMSLVNGELNQNAGPVVAREEQLVEDRGGRLQQGGGQLVKHNGEDDEGVVLVPKVMKTECNLANLVS